MLWSPYKQFSIGFKISVLSFFLLYSCSFSSTTLYYLFILSSMSFHSKICCRVAFNLDYDSAFLDALTEYLQFGKKVVFLVLRSKFFMLSVDKILFWLLGEASFL